MRHLVFIEGLWATGKSYFLKEYEQSYNSSDTLIFRNLRDYGTVRHAAYVIHPDIYKTQNLVFDRSPVTLKVLANSDLNLYTHSTISRDFWGEFYEDWINVLRSQDDIVTFIYFKPFDSYGLISESVIKRVTDYPKSNLMINMKKFRSSLLNFMHELYILEIEQLSRFVKVQLFPVEYQDSICATSVLNSVLK